MGIRLIGGDEHFGRIGFGTVSQSAADTFSAAQLPAIAEPDLIISNKKSGRVLEIDVEDVLIWDNKQWLYHNGGSPDIVGSEAKTQTSSAGITKDNTVEGSAAPTADSIAQGTFPGGSGAAVTGAAAGGGSGGPLMAGDEQPTRFVDRVEFFAIANEENATGEINQQFSQEAKTENSPYEDGDSGNTAHYLMTAAHYHLWTESAGTGGAQQVGVGALVRRISTDLMELFFDRAVLLSILDALVVSR